MNKFATAGRILNPSLTAASDQEAALRFCDDLERFIESLGIKKSLKEIGVIESELHLLAEASLVLPDYTNHPYVVSVNEVEKLLLESY